MKAGATRSAGAYDRAAIRCEGERGAVGRCRARDAVGQGERHECVVVRVPGPTCDRRQRRHARHPDQRDLARISHRTGMRSRLDLVLIERRGARDPRPQGQGRPDRVLDHRPAGIEAVPIERGKRAVHPDHVAHREPVLGEARRIALLGA